MNLGNCSLTCSHISTGTYTNYMIIVNTIVETVYWYVVKTIDMYNMFDFWFLISCNKVNVNMFEYLYELKDHYKLGNNNEIHIIIMLLCRPTVWVGMYYNPYTRLYNIESETTVMISLIQLLYIFPSVCSVL